MIKLKQVLVTSFPAPAWCNVGDCLRELFSPNLRGKVECGTFVEMKYGDEMRSKIAIEQHFFNTARKNHITVDLQND